MRGAAIQVPRSLTAGDPVEVPDHLLRATLRAAVRVTRHKMPLPLALPRRAAWLVDAVLAEGGRQSCPTAP